MHQDLRGCNHHCVRDGVIGDRDSSQPLGGVNEQRFTHQDAQGGGALRLSLGPLRTCVRAGLRTGGLRTGRLRGRGLDLLRRLGRRGRAGGWLLRHGGDRNAENDSHNQQPQNQQSRSPGDPGSRTDGLNFDFAFLPNAGADQHGLVPRNTDLSLELRGNLFLLCALNHFNRIGRRRSWSQNYSSFCRFRPRSDRCRSESSFIERPAANRFEFLLLRV